MGLVGNDSAERPCQIVDHKMDHGLTYLRCGTLPIRHIGQSFPRYPFREIPSDRAQEFNHCLEWSGGTPNDLAGLLDLLSSGLVLPTSGTELDLALALDWYKTPDDLLPPKSWPNTVVGEFVRKAKYFVDSPHISDAARKALIKKLAAAMQQHPALAAARYIVTVPGSSGDHSSTGELLAAGLAIETKKALVMTVGPQRPQRKGDQKQSVNGLFRVAQKLSDPCVIVDDVVRSGDTLREVARVAKIAGAPKVYGLVAAKTLRS